MRIRGCPQLIDDAPHGSVNEPALEPALQRSLGTNALAKIVPGIS
jgi:hypothetical protein